MTLTPKLDSPKTRTTSGRARMRSYSRWVGGWVRGGTETRGKGSGALPGPALCAQYNYDTTYSHTPNLTLSVIRNAGLDNAPAPRKDPCISVVLGALCTRGVESVGF